LHNTNLSTLPIQASAVAFYDFAYFVSVVSRQFISFVTKMEVVARITSSRLVITSSPRIWDRVDLGITMNTSLRSQWNAVLSIHGLLTFFTDFM